MVADYARRRDEEVFLNQGEKKMAKTPKDKQPEDPREKIRDYFSKRSGALARASTDLQTLVRIQCSAAGLEPTEEAMTTMAAGLAAWSLAAWTPDPPTEKQKADAAAAAAAAAAGG